jgi:hypothetical protein
VERASAEENPAAFFGDTHTAEYSAGAVRGQLMAVPMGGVETGGGATAGVVAYRRRGTSS